ncbi:MAG: chemotaxis protein CheW [Alphaproteobacteria bacterium]|nr:chemotaxis protein CheW [Alphaproteobacteria bacterium]
MDDLVRDFLAEASESMDALDRSLVRLEDRPNDPELLSEIFRVMHTIKGTCGFLGLQRLAHVAHAAEDVLGQFRDGALTPSQESVSAVLVAVDVIKALLGDLETFGHEQSGDDSAIVTQLRAIAQQGPAPTVKVSVEPLSARLGGLSSVDCAIEIALSRVKTRPGGIRFAGAPEESLQAALRDCVWQACEEGAPSALTKPLAEFGLVEADDLSALLACLEEGFIELGADSVSTAELLALLQEPNTAKPAADAAPKGSDNAASSVASQSIRVNVEALEQLMNVASELVLIRNQLIQTLRSQPDSPFAAPLQRLNHVTTELQESVMTTRMQPISAAWTKLPRLARDLAVELNKRIEVVTHGAETELDRQVLEMIKDPLTHMIRNAADHGLESPGERAKAGKSETGRITLSARHEGSQIVIEVADDGRGLQASKLRAKALTRGLITPLEAEQLSDAKIQQLIFHPGFSTAESVSAVSGCGVGMDVVRTNIEKIGGAVELSSTEGRGTRVTIRIPLTLTIVSALIVDCCGERFAMPQSAVVELVGVGGGSRRTIEHINGAPVLRLRDRLLPLISLQQLMQLAPSEAPAEQCILITSLGAFSYGIIVDRVFDTEEIVVKPAASILRSIPYYSGATILGDGAVLMILDPKGIAGKFGASVTEQAEAADRNAKPAEERTQMLIVRGTAGTPKATPLQLVSRIEDVRLNVIEYADEKAVLQYRGRLMPLIGLDGERHFGGNVSTKPVIVFDNEERAIGLVVDEIVDIVETPLVQQFKAERPGVLGSLVIANSVTDVIDIAHYWRMSADDAAPRETPSATPAIKRALIVEPSPFLHNLITPLLKMAGFQVTVVRDSAGAAAVMESEGPFDVILTDTALPERGALNALSAPVIGLYDDPFTIRQHDTEGFTGIACRFDRDEVLKQLQTLQDRNAA